MVSDTSAVSDTRRKAGVLDDSRSLIAEAEQLDHVRDVLVAADLPRFGAYIVFGRNVGSFEQVRALTDALRAARGDDRVGPLVAIDQEGGRVARLREGVEVMPSMMALGAADDLELAERAGEQTAFDLRRAGCTLNFAPVLDLALHPDNTVIGTRSLGSDPQRVAALGAAFAAGLARGGTLACAKHFPGHGDTPVDSHRSLPVIDADAATLRGRDLAAFAAVAKSVPAIMTAHVVVRAFDSQRPATSSHRIATELLRDELGFDGALVSDCLQMAAVAERADPVSAAIAALAAGVDLLTVSHDVGLAVKIAEAIEGAARDGRLPPQRLKEAYDRVMRLREAASAYPPLPVDAFPPHPGVGREIGRRAITLIRGLAHADPLTSIVTTFEGGLSEGIGLRHRLQPDRVHCPIDPRTGQNHL